MTKPKPAAKPTRWWACVDIEQRDVVCMYRKRAQCADAALDLNDAFDVARRFVVRRVEIREV